MNDTDALDTEKKRGKMTLPTQANEPSGTPETEKKQAAVTTRLLGLC